MLKIATPPEQALREMISWAIDRHFSAGSYYDFSGAITLFANKRVRSAERDLMQALAAIIMRGQKSGTIRAHGPPLLIAQILHSVLKDTAYRNSVGEGSLTPEDLKAGLIRLLAG